jgi:membrane protease YdiL (CAAX protease family)
MSMTVKCYPDMKPNKKLIVYFAMAYFFSWLVFVPLGLNHHGIIYLFPDDVDHARTMDVWHAIGGLGPVLSAILTILFFYGRKGVDRFFKTYSLKKMTLTEWLLSFSPILLFFFAIVISYFVNGEWLDPIQFFEKNSLSDPIPFLMWLLPLLTYGFGEEGGWRGYALPELQSKYSALVATIILTVFWIGWHIPTFFYRYHLSGFMLVGFVLGLFAGAIWMTFLFNYTHGNLLVVSLWHFTFNLVSMVGVDKIVSASMSTFIMLIAVVLVIRYGKKDLSPFSKKSNLFENTNHKII